MKVDRVHEKFIYHPKNLTCYYQIRVHRYADWRRVRCVQVLSEHVRSRLSVMNQKVAECYDTR
jgi:hypothetical protein